MQKKICNFERMYLTQTASAEVANFSDTNERGRYTRTREDKQRSLYES